MRQSPLLFSPLTLRSVRLRNRVVISPMCQYSAVDGLINDWHFAHLARFAVGGAALVFTEAAAVQRDGRITHGDAGIWSDAQAEAFKRVTAFIQSQGAVPAIQLAHAGRKASMQRPWHGNGPLADSDRARGEDIWRVMAPSTIPMDTGWLVPDEMSLADIDTLKQSFRDATRRSLAAGFEVAEIHGAHGYLLHEFLSPLSNKRVDRYGGDAEGRMRLALEIATDTRAAWPQDKPLFFRVSAVDGIDDGWTLDDSIALAKRLKAIGIDVIDCSSGGLLGSATAARVKRYPGFQVPYAAAIKRDAGIATMAVGLILEAQQAEDILRNGEADLIDLLHSRRDQDPGRPSH